MTEQIIEISDRGQITIPKKVRKLFPGQLLSMAITADQIVLTPVQTVDSFFDELDERQKDWEKNGGITLEEMKKKYDIK